MKKIGFLQNVKIIVLVGYILLFLLAVFGGYQIYQELLKFSNQNQPFAERKQLNLISNALVSMYEAESVRKIMLSENFDTHYLDSSYTSVNQKVHFYLDSLYRLSNDKSLHNSLDTVNNLLEEKENNLKNMIELLEAIKKLPYSKQILTTVLSKNDVNSLYNIFETNFSKQKTDSSFFVKKKKGFLSRLKDVFGPGEDSTKIVSKQTEELKDTTFKKPAQLLTDTIVQFINTINNKSNRKKAVYLNQLATRQNAMLYYDESLTNQIHQILYGLENKERKYVNNLLIDRDKAVNKSSRIMSLIAWASLFTVIIFLALTLGLINKSQIYRNKLEQSKKHAEDLMKSRERLLLMISHDIKSPLSSIIGHMELLSREKMPPAEKEHLINMKSSSEHILELVNKLMDYHKLEQGKSEITKMPFSPYQLMQDVYQSFIPVINNRLIYTSQNTINKQKVFESDPFTIKQVVNNLISNAIKFTKSGSINISSLITENNILQVSVKDSGVGIKPEDKKKIFDEFERVGSTEDKTRIEGYGLGLAITYKLVKLLGGDINVESEYEKGSEFIVSIPLKPLLMSVEELSKGKKEEHEKSSSGKMDAKILFIDDDLVMLNVFEKLLQREGAEVTICDDSKEALALLKDKKFDIILTDIQMPQINGFELVGKIREMNSEYHKNVPVIALSARSDVSEEKFKNAGFTGFLAKPVPFNVLLDKICESISCKNVEIKSDEAHKGINSLIEFVEDDEETAKDILNVFISENKIKIKELSDSLKANNWQQIKATAHKLLPLMRIIGADEMVKILVALENGEISSEKVTSLIKMVKDKNKEVIDFMNKKYPEKKV
ncbi:conserved hypothetical protein [uncultured Paludibacter sp.]|uniref:histidine kinase n=1 Tax=uncultured Paludibacter sp. TaxID=497635 RepID=A0A653A8M1_9BACT|nr:conserved hypothetical protein [uncultured Paludibacter sp.]